MTTEYSDASIPCTACNGTRTVRALINHADGGCTWESIVCRNCKGDGNISDARQWELDQATRLREDRINRGLSLREEAKRRGLSVMELSRMEHP